MTAYEAYQYSSNSLQNIAEVNRAIKAGHDASKLPPNVAAKITPGYEARMQTVQARAIAQIEIELKQWYE